MQVDRPIAIVLVIIIIILLVFFLLLPEYKKFQDKQLQLGEKMAEYVAKYDYFAAIDKIYYDLQARKVDIEKIDDALPQDPTLGKTVYYLQDAAKQNGLIVRSLFLSKSPKSAAGSTSIITKDISFSLDLTGEYSSLQSFLKTLESSSRIFEITNISFASQAGPPYDFSVQIKTYSY